MGGAAIVWHAVTWSPDFVFPAKDVISLYRSAGIDLSLQRGPDIVADPASAANYQTLVNSYRSDTTLVNGLKPGRLIVGLERDASSERCVCGELHDVATRGLAAIYRNADYLTTTPSAMVETIAHEIGHLFNLTHDTTTGGGNGIYCSVMRQATGREDANAGAIAQAWHDAAVQATPGGHFLAPNPSPAVYPLSPAHYSQLGSDPNFRPWASAFSGDGGVGAQDRALELNVDVQSTKHAVGGVFAYSLAIRNRSKRAVYLPAPVGLEFGTLRLEITGPDGTVRLLTPRSLACATRGIEIAPGKTQHYAAYAYRDGTGAFLRTRGTHKIRFYLPSHDAAAEIGIDVDHVPTPRLHTALTQRRVGASVQAALGAKSLDRANKALLGLHASRLAGDPREAAKLRALALHPSVPAAIRSIAVREDVQSIIRDGVKGLRSKALRRGRELLSDNDDPAILAAIERVLS